MADAHDVFVTGTDTGCGKTLVTAMLARHLVDTGRRVACFKPIASGCRRVDGRLVNDDALALMDAMNVDLAYDQVNPYALEPAIAPHIAAEKQGIHFDLAAICAEITAIPASVRLVEGVGGWLVPLDAERTLPALPQALGASVILVVGMRLGCLNHALLTARAIRADGLSLAGWVANHLDPEFEEPDANQATLESMVGAPLLAQVVPGAGGPALAPAPDMETRLLA